MQYAFTLYHDEPDDAAVDSRTEYPFRTLTSAIRSAQKALTDYWQTASVYRGTYHEPIFGQSPEWWTDDEQFTAVRVGPDWVE